MSQLADVDIEPSVGMLALYDVLRCCCYWTNVFCLHCFMCVSSCTLWVNKKSQLCYCSWDVWQHRFNV